MGDASAVVLEVLRQSGLVWAVNGRPTQSWIVVPRRRTARLPVQARLAAGDVWLVETRAGMVGVHRRLLSDAECSELAVDFRASRWWLGLGQLGERRRRRAAGGARRGIPWPPLIGIAPLTTAACDVPLSVIRGRRRLRRDLRVRFVAIPEARASADPRFAR